MLALLRGKRADIDVMLAEASRPPLCDLAFDGALFFHVLHLVPDAEATIRATLRLVRAGGVLIEARDDRRPGIRDTADVIIREAARDAAGIEMADWTPYDRGTSLFERLTREAGATLEQRELAQWTSGSNARRIIDRLARRDYSSSWRITDEALPLVIERVTPRLAELYGGLDREVEHVRSVSMTVARLP